MNSLDHARLEQVIYQKQTLDELLLRSFDVLNSYSIADYVGSPQLKPGYKATDCYAAGFFADQGAYRKTIELVVTGDPTGHYNVAIFATFLVVEIMPGITGAEFLVLVPHRSSQLEGGAYVGLMKTQNTDVLIESLGLEPERVKLLADEVGDLLAYLRSAPETEGESVSGSWFGRLFNKRE